MELVPVAGRVPALGALAFGTVVGLAGVLFFPF
jgi:hypothetical protein